MISDNFRFSADIVSGWFGTVQAHSEPAALHTNQGAKHKVFGSKMRKDVLQDIYGNSREIV
jgi:hypothetical protein